jgi:hypothetical protein
VHFQHSTLLCDRSTENYRWEQNANEVIVFVPIDAGTSSDNTEPIVLLRTLSLKSHALSHDDWRAGISKKHIKWDLEITNMSLEIDGKKIIQVRHAAVGRCACCGVRRCSSPHSAAGLNIDVR